MEGDEEDGRQRRSRQSRSAVQYSERDMDRALDEMLASGDASDDEPTVVGTKRKPPVSLVRILEPYTGFDPLGKFKTLLRISKLQRGASRSP